MGGDDIRNQRSEMQVRTLDWMEPSQSEHAPRASSALHADAARTVSERADPPPTLLPGGVPASNTATNTDLPSGERNNLIKQEVDR